MKKLDFIAMSGALILGLLASGAEATVNSVTVKDINLGVLQTGQFVNDAFTVTDPLKIGDFVEFQDNISGVGDFSRKILFSVSNEAIGRGFLTAFQEVAGLDLNILGGPVTKIFNSNTHAYTFTGLASGIEYSLIASGHAITPSAGVAGSFQVLAVPEPEEWAMMVVGASLIAFQVRRKQKALEQGNGAISG